MSAAVPLPVPPDFARRLGAILVSLAALVAHGFARDPLHAPLIVPLWTLITRAARRAERAFSTLAAGRAPRPRAPHAAGPRRASPFPTARAWLIRLLGHQAAAHASQLAALLAEPEAAAALAASPAARRALAPVRRMLGLVPPPPRRPRRPRPPPAAAPAAPPRPTPPAWLQSAPPGPKRPWWLPPKHPRRPPPAGGWESIKAKRHRGPT